MIDILHNKINDIVPINGLEYDNSSHTCIIHYTDPNIILTNEQQTLINNLLSSWPLTQEKLIKTEILNTNLQLKLNDGWITPYGWKLGLTNEDILLLNGNFMLAKEASSLGLTNNIFVIDKENIPHELNLENLTILMIQYGQARALISAQYNNLLTLINNSNNLEELNNIELTL